MATYTGYFDGASLDNPGKVGLGAVLYGHNGEEIDSSYVFKEHGTNNEAEYLSAILLLRRAIRNKIRSLKCFGDSQLVVKQIAGEYACNKPELKKLLQQVKTLMNEFDDISFEWVRRDKNKRADELSKLAIEKEDTFRQVKAKKLTGSDSGPSVTTSVTEGKPDIQDNVESIENNVHEVVIQPTANKQNQKVYTKTFTRKRPKQQPVVKAINGGRYLISEDSVISIYDTKRQLCSCPAFIRANECKHHSIFNELTATG